MVHESPLFERLHQAIRLAHRRLERRIDRIDLCCPNLDIHGYRRLLQDFWGFYQPLERKLVVLTDRDLPSFYYSQQRRKAPCLNRDLLSLGMTEADIAALPLCGRLPAMPTLPRAFGVLYAVESTPVCGRLAGAHLLEKLGISPSRGGSFFSTFNLCGDQYRREFNKAMATAVEEPIHQIHAIEAAVDTLDCLEAWLEYRHRPQRTDYSRWNLQSEPQSYRGSHAVSGIGGAA